MLDMNFIRQEPDAVRAGVAARGDDAGMVDRLLALDEQRRALLAVPVLWAILFIPAGTLDYWEAWRDWSHCCSAARLRPFRWAANWATKWPRAHPQATKGPRQPPMRPRHGWAQLC